MTSPVDHMAQAIRVVDGNNSLGAGALAEAIVEDINFYRGLSDMVLPLHWVDPQPGDPGFINSHALSTLGEEYTIFHDGEKYHFWELGEGPCYDTLEAAKAAIDRHHRDSVLSRCFGVPLEVREKLGLI